MKNIKKKILPQYFESVLNKTKTFELRKDEDNVQVGDCLDLLEWDGEKYTGRNVRCNVTYVLRNCPQYGLMDGYCIIGIDAVEEVVKIRESDEKTFAGFVANAINFFTEGKPCDVELVVNGNPGDELVELDHICIKTKD